MQKSVGLFYCGEDTDGYGQKNFQMSPDAPSSPNMDSGQTGNPSEFKLSAHVNILHENCTTVNTKQQRKVWRRRICKSVDGFPQKNPSLFSQLGVSHFVLWLFEERKKKRRTSTGMG